MSQTRSDSDLIRELASEMRDVTKLVLDLLLMQGNVPDNVKKQKRLNLQGLRERYGVMGTMDAKLNALVKEMETEYAAGVDYVPPPKDEEEGNPEPEPEPEPAEEGIPAEADPEPEPEPEPEAGAEP